MDSLVSTCPICFASFSRSEHLRRHCASHTAYRPFWCSFCNASFKRRDVLRKHLKTCSHRLKAGAEMPRAHQPGKKLRSCDFCAKQKTACNGAMPCSTCATRGHVCTYERTGSSTGCKDVSIHIEPKDTENRVTAGDELNSDYSDTVIEDWVVEDSSGFQNATGSYCLTSMPQNRLLPQPTIRNDCLRFEFLLNFTHYSGLNLTFNHLHRDRRWCSGKPSVNVPKALFNGCRHPLPEGVTNLDEVNDFAINSDNGRPIEILDGSDFGEDCSNLSPSWNLDLEFNEICQPILADFVFNDTGQGQERYPNSQSQIMFMVEWLQDSLFPATKGIWDLFRSKVSQGKLSTADRTSACTTAAAANCLKFFSPSNLRRFLGFFWSKWNPHCPIVHKPTFNGGNASVLLVLSMSIIGACMSDDQDETIEAHSWLDLAEEVVFEGLQGFSSLHAKEVLDLKLDAIEAAYFTCLVQNWEGSDVAKKRIRQQRLTTVVAAARDIGLTCAVHHWARYNCLENFDWLDFVRQERMIRTFTYIFLLDSAFVIFNNSPPRMIVHEMQIDFSCPEIVWQSPTLEECFFNLRNAMDFQHLPSERVTLADAVEVLAQPFFDTSTSLIFARMSVLNLFTLVSAFHSVIFQLGTSLICLPTTLSPIRVALERWRFAWDVALPRLEEETRVVEEAWQEPGFMKNAKEFWFLAIASLDKASAARQPRLGFLKEKPGVGKVPNSSWDETSMSQVTDLMLSLLV